jgi:hypothetical protein
METQPLPIQVLLLWKLATNNGSAWKADLKPDHITDKPKRDPLVQSGLISVETRRREIPGKRASRGLYLTLEDKGWAWLADHLDAPISRSQAAADVLTSVLRMLQRHLERNNMVLADFIETLPEDDKTTIGELQVTDSHVLQPQALHGEQHDSLALEGLEDRVTAAYATLSGHRSNARVRLADLRQKLSDIPRKQLDHVLQEMSRDGRVVLNRLDNPSEITSADEEAKLTSPLGDPRHIMHMEIPVHV